MISAPPGAFLFLFTDQFFWIFPDIFPDPVQFGIGADDMIIVSGLPRKIESPGFDGNCADPFKLINN